DPLVSPSRFSSNKGRRGGGRSFRSRPPESSQGQMENHSSTVLGEGSHTSLGKNMGTPSDMYVAGQQPQQHENAQSHGANSAAAAGHSSPAAMIDAAIADGTGASGAAHRSPPVIIPIPIAASFATEDVQRGRD
ncbi:hypothetical protein Vretifemale_18431, partial [Volvox reticuliferus]